MICGTSGRSGTRWLLWTGLTLACLVAVGVAMTMQKRALEARVTEEVAAIEGFAEEELSTSLKGVDLSEPLGEGGVTTALTQQLDRGIMSEAGTVRIRIFATDGILLYSTDEGDGIGAARIGDPDAVHAAAGGATTSVVSDDAVSRDGGNAQSLRLLQVFAPVPDSSGSPGSVVEADLKYRPIENASKKPWSTVMLGSGIAAIVCFVLALFGLSNAIASRRLAARSGFAAQPGELKKARKEAEKEAKARAALENQLEGLRDQLKELREANAAAAKANASEKQASTRGTRAETGSEDGAGGDEGHEALMRIAEGLAQEADQKRQLAEVRAQEAEAEAARLELVLAKAQRSEGSDRSETIDADEAARVAQELETLQREHRAALARVEELERSSSVSEPTPAPVEVDPKLRERLTELEVLAATHAREAAEYRNRAEATEAVKIELETKVAQLTSKAEEAARQVVELQEQARVASSPPVVEATEGTEQLVAALAAARAERETLLAKIDAERETVRAQAVAELERIDAEASRNLSSVRDELTAAQARIVELESAAAVRVPAAPEMEQEFESLRLANEATETTLADLRASYEQLESEKAGLAEVRDETERELTEARTKLAGVDERIRQSDELIRQADARAEAAEARFAATSDLSAEVATVRTELEAERDRARRAEQRAEDAENLQRALEQHGTALANALEEERTGRAEAATSVEEAGRRFAESEETVRSLESRLAELEEAGRDEVAARTEVERRSEELVAELERERERATTAETTLASLRTTEESVRSEADRLRAAAAAAEASAASKADALERELVSERAGIVEREATVASLREQAEAHGARERELETTIAQLEASLASAAEKDAKITELTTMVETNAGLVRERDTLMAELETRATDAENRVAQAETLVAQAEGGATDRESRVAEAETRAAQADARVVDADARAAAAEARLAQMEPRLAELETRAMAAEQRGSEQEVRARTAEQRAAEAETRAAGVETAPRETSDGGRIAELEQQIGDYSRELEQMENRLRRAYADAEEARAQLVSGGGTTSGLGGGDPDEVARLRRELAQAMERASAAENRSSRLQADLAEARIRAGEDPEPPPEVEIEEDEGPSLRFRLAQAASRKKGITGAPGGVGGDETSMWS